MNQTGAGKNKVGKNDEMAASRAAINSTELT